ncbi:rifampicin phosphotransferase [Aphomia sociella]
MELFDVFLQAGLTTSLLVVYLIFFKKRPSPSKGNYLQPGWNYPLKKVVSRFYAIGRWKARCPTESLNDLPRTGMYDGWDSIDIRASSSDGAAVLLGVRKLCGRQSIAEVTLYVKLADGSSYRLPRHPDTITCLWEHTAGAWSAGGLKIQVLKPETRLRILFNGLLTTESGVTHHVQFNFIWTSGTNAVRYPKDWSTELAAETLALEQWRDSQWLYLLGKWEEASWLQWGVTQGRFQSFDQNGVSVKDEYLRLRGVRERSWAPHGYEGRNRSATITASAKDGTLVHLRGLSYKNIMTQCISGSVRYPNYKVESITATDFILEDFCETVDGIPKAYTINVSTKSNSFRMVIRINADGGKLLSGVPYQQELYYRTLVVNIDESSGSGILELGYAPTVISDPTARLSPSRTLKWLSASEVGPVGYCLPFEARAAACPDYVGGKGASLALLASVQDVEGYKVPPGFCLTIRALEKHLDANPQLLSAITDIEAANEDYNENIFKDKCAKAVELFVNTEIVEDVKIEILSHLSELRKATTKQDLEQRFAVRSSAVGEDSETLSAAGQNETILGCSSDEDVVRAVQKCWGSMFAFTSAYYRRQNGQACRCGGGVVVQALAGARVAGVMFTRHPDRGDASRLLLTANYGLGETVVSGSVEPDSIVVKRGENNHLAIMKIELGSKTQRVTTASGGVTTEDVPETERGVPCLSETESLKLAQHGVAQEELWGAGRDIEWAISKNGTIYLLQARPITSLERWTEEELLHELDTPILSDEDLITFGNTGEVFPKAATPLSVDFVIRPLTKAMNKTIANNMEPCEESIVLTHNRVGIALYNSTYRRVPKQINMGIRMLDMAIHGRKVADQKIFNVALRRRPPHWTDRIKLIKLLVKCLVSSKWKMNDNIKTVNQMHIKTDSDDPLEMFDAMIKQLDAMGRLSVNHTYTTAASTSSQFIAMSVLLEGATDFTVENCNEINALLSSGDVLSAEVPQYLAKLAREIEDSGSLDEFKAQDPKNAMHWLMINLPHIHVDILEFLNEHGHRAVMEFDMVTKPWALVPEELMKILQNIRVTEKENQDRKSDSEIIASLTTPKKSATRKVLSWVLPLCRRTVRHRESTKAHLILGVHKLRLAALELGKQLVRRWYLPHHDLVFFFQADELTEYITNRDPALLRKAMQRQQYYQKWCKLKYAELNTGWVQPLPVKGPSVTTGDVKLEATAVCGGEVIARACIVKDLSEIHQLKQGDVLITHATDIGWSPYFPLLTGIVTELGGLISHGAVIAREYGLPCLVGATDATDIFKTGDTVRLSATKGLIEKVQLTDKSEENKS